MEIAIFFLAGALVLAIVCCFVLSKDRKKAEDDLDIALSTLQKSDLTVQGLPEGEYHLETLFARVDSRVTFATRDLFGLSHPDGLMKVCDSGRSSFRIVSFEMADFVDRGGYPLMSTVLIKVYLAPTGRKKFERVN